MGSNSEPALALLFFKHFEMEEAPPVSTLFDMAATDTHCGIYVLEFEDGARYVGQTVNIVSRYAQHRRKHGDIVAFSFAPCAVALLDVYERLVIKYMEEEFSLRNKKLTDLPGGHGEFRFQTQAGNALQLPWDREKRATVLAEPRGSPLKRYWELATRPDYPVIRRQLARYVHETIPGPNQAGGSLWSLTALPSTGQRKGVRRLFTLNAGSVEVLFVTERDLHSGGTQLEWRMNLSLRGLPETLRGPNGVRIRGTKFNETDHYRSVGPLMAATSVGTDGFASALNQKYIVDAAYRLNVMLMRRSTSVYAKFHNHSFAFDVLREAYSLQ